MNDQFDHELQSLLSGSLRDRASRADTHGRGFSDVRRRVRRRRQRQTALALLPTAVGVGWFASRPVADDPLRPADGASGPTATTAACRADGVPAAPTGEPTTVVTAVVTVTTISWVSSEYVVQEGDSWKKIAEDLGPDLQLLLGVNGRTGEDPNTVLARGDVIAIPPAAAGPGEPYVIECVTVSPTTVADVEPAVGTESSSLQTSTTVIG